MLFLVFRLDRERYALDTHQVVEVLPRVSWKSLPQAPEGVLGIFNYRGHVVPLLDLTALLVGRPARLRMSTRIVVVEYQVGRDPKSGHRLGLLAEEVTETMRREAGEFADAGLAALSAPSLGPATVLEGELVQWVEIDRLLPAPVRDRLFASLPDEVESAAG